MARERQSGSNLVRSEVSFHVDVVRLKNDPWLRWRNCKLKRRQFLKLNFDLNLYLELPFSILKVFFSFYKYFAITCNISLSTMLSFIYNRSSWPPITWDCSWYLQRKRFLNKNYFKSIFRFSNLSFTKVRHLLQMKGNRAFKRSLFSGRYETKKLRGFKKSPLEIFGTK